MTIRAASRPIPKPERSSYAKRFILPQLGARHVASVTRQDIEELHASLHKTPYQANWVLSQLSVLFGKAVEWEWRGDNPCEADEALCGARAGRVVHARGAGKA